VGRVTIRVTVWDEDQPGIDGHYPTGIHGAIADGLVAVLGDRVRVRTATMDQPGHGLPPEVLDATDVLVWWGHLRHDEVDDAVVAEVQRRVLAGMGLLVLHSGQGAKVFRTLLGTTGELGGWRHGDRELLWTVDPGHPIARGVPHPVVIGEQEARCSAAAAAFAGVGAGSSTSARATRSTRCTTSRRSSGSSPTPPSGRARHEADPGGPWTVGAGLGDDRAAERGRG
jgi:hypothetical protein